MRPDVDAEGREDHGRAATWALVCGPLAAHLAAGGGPPAVGVVLWLGLVFAVAQLLLAPGPSRPPAGPQRRTGDRV